MKASELMIGDWVYYSHTEDGIAPYKEVICIKAEDLCCDACIIETHYEPIPLTLEILEKNGFIRDGESWWYQDFRIVLSTSNGVSLVCGRQMRFLYVHQLQQALLLCGIEKEITI